MVDSIDRSIDSCWLGRDGRRNDTSVKNSGGNQFLVGLHRPIDRSVFLKGNRRKSSSERQRRRRTLHVDDFHTMLYARIRHEGVARRLAPIYISCRYSFDQQRSQLIRIIDTYPLGSNDPSCRRCVAHVHGNSHECDGTFESQRVSTFVVGFPSKITRVQQTANIPL